MEEQNRRWRKAGAAFRAALEAWTDEEGAK
jgi:hypothetical protein